MPYPPKNKDNVYIRIITPQDPEQRGAQLSVSFSLPINEVKKELEKRAVVVCKHYILTKTINFI